MAPATRPRTKRVALSAAGLVALVVFVYVWFTDPHASAPTVPAQAIAETASAPQDRAARVGPTAAQSAARPAPPAPSAPPSAAAPPAAHSPDGGDVALFGQLVKLGQSLVLAEALAKNAANADAWVDRLCDQHRRLTEKPPVAQSDKHEHDAAAFMAPLIDWEAPLNDPPGKLHLSDALRSRMDGLGADSMIKITEQDLQGLDFSWLQQLAAFDHWSLLATGRLKDHPIGDFYTDPIPNYSSLQRWAKLRFALAFRRGDLAQASVEVRHLADVIATQGILIATAISVAIYNLDARARELAAAAGLDVTGWPVPDKPALQSWRTMAFASMYFTYPGVSEATLRRAAKCMITPCAALGEGAGANRAFGSSAGTSNLAVVEELSVANHCESALLSRASASRELPAGEALNALADEVEHQIPKLLSGGN